MDDLRREIRAAFEREQSAYPPVPALRPNLVRAARAKPRPQRNFQWLAVAAALMLAVLVVVALMSSRPTNRGTVSPPKAAPSPMAGDYGRPPAGVPLVYVGDPNHPGWYIGFDWNGVPRGTVKLAQPIDANSALMQSPDGQVFSVSPSAKGGAGQFLDRLGAPTTSVSPALYGIWADDSRHLCAVAYDLNLYTWTLVLAAPNEATRKVSVIARDSSAGQTGIGAVSCSIKNDRAIAVRTDINYPSEMWVVQLSTGKILTHRTFTNGNSLSGIVASADGNLLAENSISSVGQVGTGPSTDVRSVSDNRLVATLTPTLGVLAFSGDDAFALVTTSGWFSGSPVHLAVVELATGKTVWQDDGTQRLAGFAVEPTGAAFAILYTANDQVAHPVVGVVLVYGYGTGKGQAVGIPGTYVRP